MTTNCVYMSDLKRSYGTLQTIPNNSKNKKKKSDKNTSHVEYEDASSDLKYILFPYLFIIRAICV